MSAPDNSTRVFLFIVLLMFAGLGLLADYWALTATGGADGLGTFFPMIGAILFFPFQLLAIGAVIASRMKPAADPDVLVVAGDEDLAEAMRPPTLGRIAAWMLGVPALVMLLCAVVSAAAGSGLVAPIAELGTFLWGPMWALGMIVAGVAFGRDNLAWPLALAPLYPVAGALYMFS